MDPQYSPQSRTERLIASLRVVLAASSLFAIWLDPTQPAKYANIAYGLMAGYVVYAGVLWAVVWKSPLPVPRLGVLTLAGDLAAFSLFIYLTEGPPASPFFVYFIFALMCAAVRWQWRGTLVTAVVSLAAFIGMGLYQTRIAQDELLNRFIIRAVYLSVVAIFLGYLGAHQQQLRHEIARLASWPRALPQDVRTLVQEVLGQAGSILGAARVVVQWEESEEPWAHLAWWSGAVFDWERAVAGEARTAVDPALAEADFFCPDAGGDDPTVLVAAAAGAERWSGEPLRPEFRQRFRVGAVLSLRLRGEEWDGRLFCLDKANLTSDDLVLGRIVAAQAVARLDHFYLLRRLQQAAVIQERVRLARDLHDGLLQSLTGTALQLETVRRLLDGAGGPALERLREVQESIVAEQRSLRAFIRELKPGPEAADPADAGLGDRLASLARRLERLWDVAADIRVTAIPPDLPEGLAHDVCHIAQEALVNAARHGRASVIRLEVSGRPGRLGIRVVDNGNGFAFTGRLDLEELTRTRRGPASLMERITSRQGALVIESSPAGAVLDIDLPMAGRV